MEMNKQDQIKEDLIQKIERIDEAKKVLEEIKLGLEEELKSFTDNKPWYLPFLTKKNTNSSFFSEMKNIAESDRHSLFKVLKNHDDTFKAELIYDKNKIFLDKFFSQKWRNDEVEYIEFNEEEKYNISDIRIDHNFFSFSIIENRIMITEPIKLKIK